MGALSNDPARCELMNLGWGHQGHGPYLVRQEGYPPGSADMRPQWFILQRDGRWLLNFAFAMLAEEEQERQLFHSLSDLLVFLDQHSAAPVTADAALPANSKPDEIMAHFENCTHRILQGIRNCSVTAIPR